MKARYALWPVMIFGAVSLASACSSDSGTSTGPNAGGSDGEGGSGANTGATTSTGGIDSAAGMSTDAGSSTGGVSGGAAGAAGTAGAAGAAGATSGDLCEGQELDCPNDDDPCTEDECNPATGECGIPRSETSCDDGKYCNGEDTCDDGKCTAHAGNPCSGTCNEAGDYCECASKTDCPADIVSAWGACAYGTECVETAMRNRTVTKYSCNDVGKCIAGAPMIESDSAGCVRETDTIACTDDAKPCNGVEKCKNGNCVGNNVNPCAGQAATPFCYDSGTMCRKCTGSTAANSVGCVANTEKCCSGSCIPAGNTCNIIINPQIINPQISSQIIINPQ